MIIQGTNFGNLILDTHRFTSGIFSWFRWLYGISLSGTTAAVKIPSLHNIGTEMNDVELINQLPRETRVRPVILDFGSSGNIVMTAGILRIVAERKIKYPIAVITGPHTDGRVLRTIAEEIRKIKPHAHLDTAIAGMSDPGFPIIARVDVSTSPILTAALSVKFDAICLCGESADANSIAAWVKEFRAKKRHELIIAECPIPDMIVAGFLLEKTEVSALMPTKLPWSPIETRDILSAMEVHYTRSAQGEFLGFVL